MLISKFKALIAYIISIPLVIRIIYILKQNRRKNQKQITVIAPYFYENNIRDGYFQRIKAIDNEVLYNFFKLYLTGSGGKISVKLIDKDHIEIIFNCHSKLQNLLTGYLIKQCNAIYCHSIFQVMPDAFSHKMLEKIFFAKIPFILDLHGIVPEELSLEQKFSKAKVAEETERYLIEHVNTIVVVTENMKKHIQNKYRKTPVKMIILPMFPADFNTAYFKKFRKFAANDSKPVVVYSGGLQKWQNIKLMQTIIVEAGNIFDYRIFVSDVKVFMDSWENRPDLTDLRVESLSPEEVLQEYPQCQYGFILRDDIAVNNVSCPTKLIEYLQNGIIPIMKTPHIGDFFEMGLHYIDYRDFVKNKLPVEDIRFQMAQANYEILQRIICLYKEGREELRSELQSQ